MSNDEHKGNEVITFNITENMSNAGISQFILKGGDFIIKFNEGGMRCIPFNRTSRSVSKAIRKFDEKLVDESNHAIV